MPPRKKPKTSTATTNASSTKKSNAASSQNHQQPSQKFGIQHFFVKHTQKEKSQQQRQSQEVLSQLNPKTTTTESKDVKSVDNGDKAVICHENLKPIDENVVVENNLEVSPPVSKSAGSLQSRFNFSPGMLIKQSQDDGVEEVTWKISPVNERLQAVSKQFPHLLKLLKSDSSSNLHNPFTIRSCSLSKTSPCKASDVSTCILSPPSKQLSERLLSSSTASSGVGLKSLTSIQDGTSSDANASLTHLQSPFQTPPSLPYCHDRVPEIVECKRKIGGQLGLRQHKKALLEILDQVEDAISVEESVPSDGTTCAFETQEQNGDKTMQTDRPTGVVTSTSDTVVESLLCHRFLVLEASEKHHLTDSSRPRSPCKVLRLLNEQSGEERTAFLWDEWFYSVVAPGDTVNIIGEFDDQGKCNVNHDNNLLIVHPDVLLSGTRVAASFSCPRRSVLDERLKSAEHSTAALVGTLLHQIFQAGLLKDNPTRNFLKEQAALVLQKNIESLYACGVNENDIMKTLVDAIPKLLNWIFLFKNPQDSQGHSVNFGSEDESNKLRISEVIDIEEMAWAPKYGLKGMIDASVRVKVNLGSTAVDERILPLEFKTGKSPNGQSAMEHSAQVILYTLIMSERYLREIDSGLLYYLQSDQTQGIMVRRSDVVGLIIRRNELANDILKASITQQLPPMLRSPSMCKGCRHLNVCSVYHKVQGGSTESSGLGDLFDQEVHHLSASHCQFLRQWDRLIDLEAKETQLLKNELWRSQSLKKDHTSSCLSSVVLDTSNGIPCQNSLKDGRYVYRFTLQKLATRRLSPANGDSMPPPLMDDLNCTLKTGDYVILSTECGDQTIASGVITYISGSHVSVSFGKRLRLPSSNCSSEAKDLLQQVWRIDKDELMTPFSVMRFNLIQVFLRNEQSSHIRKMIVDLEAPRFDSGCLFSQDPAISYIWSVKSLNGDQRRAILKILTAKDYALILGMPGTGKTSTMVHAVRALLIRGASILLASYTNSAVDNLLIKLKAQGIDFLRIGRLEAVHEDVRSYCFSSTGINTVEDVRLRLEQVKVVAVTCLGISSPLLANKKFDVCIMDEAGQITLPISLGPLTFASRFVLVGDHYQLPPLVQSAEARENGMGVSLFCRLSEAHPQAISALQSQYRMSQDIMELSNALIYSNRLRCGSPEIASAKLIYSCSTSCSPWLKEVLNPSITVVFINTDMVPAYEAKDSKNIKNPIEAHVIAQVTKELVNRGIEGEDIGIITPYNAQVNLIRTAIDMTTVEVHTIDKYQGRDKQCILVSFVRSSKNPRNYNSSLLGDWHRINVALTRAKKKLIMVGSCKTLSKVPLLKLLVEKVEEVSGILNLSSNDINNSGKHQRHELTKSSNSQIRLR